MQKVIEKRYCGFKTISEDGAQITNSHPLKKSNGFKMVVKEEQNDQEESDDGNEFSVPFKKRKTTFDD